MNAAEQSEFYKRFIMASSDEDNAARLHAEATKSPENFNLIMAILARQNSNPVLPLHPSVVQAPIAEPSAFHRRFALPIEQLPVVVPNPPAPLPPALPLPQDPLPQHVGQGRAQLTRQQLLDLNALGKRDRTSAINLLGLNANERKSLVNRLWRLRHPSAERVANR
jgi:hypothetical protein